MNMKEYLKSWEGTQAENRWGRIFQAFLIAIVFILVLQVFSRDTIVTVQPFTLTEEAWVTKQNSSQSYKEAWAFALVQLIGNVTPSSVDFIKERISPLLAPNIYQDTIDAIETQAIQIKEDRVSMRYEPRFVEYEKETDKVFVYGYSNVKGASGDEVRNERTYEFVIAISNFAPVLKYVETYEGKPKTTKVLAQLLRKEEARRKNND